MKRIERLQFITMVCQERSLEEQTLLACQAGIKWIQVRIKNSEYDYRKEQALRVLQICRKFEAVCIVNDDVELAREIIADGVHLGKNDMCPKEARKLLGQDATIGATANSFSDIESAVTKGVDYIGLGPLRYTQTKENLSPILGEAGIKDIMQQIKGAGQSIPVIVIGGVVPQDVKALLAAGVHGVAVSSGIATTVNPLLASKEFLSEIAYG